MGIQQSRATEKWLLLPWIIPALLVMVGVPIPLWLQYGLLIGSIVITGIPHGALDHLVDAQNKRLEGRTFSIGQFLVHYLAKMFLFGMIWFFSPLLALMGFVIMSALHFGETDIPVTDFQSEVQTKWLQFFYGLGLLGFLLLGHLKEVTQIIAALPGFHLILSKTPGELVQVWGLLFLSATIFLVIFISYRSAAIRFHLLIRSIFILVLLYLLPLALAFTFYFGCWHSITSMTNIRRHLNTNPKTYISWPDLFKRSFPLSLVASFMIAVLIYIMVKRYSISSTMITFFIGIAMLTAPHLSVMSEMYGHLKKRRFSI